MTKYELLYGVTVDHFPNERENVREKLDLATKRYVEVNREPYSEEQQQRLHKIWEAVRWADKILKDIDNE